MELLLNRDNEFYYLGNLKAFHHRAILFIFTPSDLIDFPPLKLFDDI